MEAKLFIIAHYGFIILAIYFILKIGAMVLGWTQATKIPAYLQAQKLGKNPDYIILKSIVKHIAYILICIALAFLFKKQ